MLLALLLAGCTPNPFPEDTLPRFEERPVEASFSAPYDDVWAATLSVFSDLYPVDELDKANGRLTTEWVVGQSDYIFNVFGGTRIPEKIRYRIAVEVGQKNGKSLVRVRSHEQVEKDIVSANLVFTGSLYEWIDVPSSTSKERDALERVQRRLDRNAGRKADVDYRD